jgi:hypothetical protein
MLQNMLGMTDEHLVDRVRVLQEDLDDCAEIARRLRELLGYATGAGLAGDQVAGELLGVGRLDAIRHLVAMLEASTTGE